MYIDGFIGGAKRSAVGVGRMSDACRIASPCRADHNQQPSPAGVIMRPCPLPLSSQLTAAGTNGTVLTPPPRTRGLSLLLL